MQGWSTWRRPGEWPFRNLVGAIDWRLLAFAAGLLWLVAILLSRQMPLYDAHAYWVAEWADPYDNSVEGMKLAYLYSPAFLQLIAPLRALPIEWFGAAWVVITAAALAAITRHWLLIALLIPITLIELEVGNIHFLLGLAIFVGMTYPVTWAFVLLTKVTPGIGLVWFAARREWRSLAIAVGFTLAVVAVSFAVAPGQWFGWVDSLTGNAQQQWPYPLLPVPLWVRLVAAVGLIAWGARTDRKWTLIVGCTLAMPTLWPSNLAVLLALPLFVDRMRVR